MQTAQTNSGHVDKPVESADPSADARDAARYRWLRDVANKVLDRAPIVVMADVEFNVGFGDIRTGPRLDGAIDAELAKAGAK